MIKKNALVVIGISSLIIFVLFSFFVRINTFRWLDLSSTLFLQKNLPRFFDEPFSFLSLIGQFEPALVVLTIILLFRRKLSGLIILFLFAVSHIIELYGKTVVMHMPPSHDMLRTKLPFQFPSFYIQTNNSYPSGHAARAFFITIIIFIIVQKSTVISQKQKIFIFGLLICYDIFMLISRVYLGEHWISDIIGGSLIGLGLSLISGILL